jgi:hypothetical protein
MIHQTDIDNHAGKQHYHCPNCGSHQWDEGISVSVERLMCSEECRLEFLERYVNSAMGKRARKDRPYRGAVLVTPNTAKGKAPISRGLTVSPDIDRKQT